MQIVKRSVVAAIILLAAIPANAQLLSGGGFTFVQPSIATLAGDGNPTTTNGSGTAASFKSLQSIAADTNGNIYVADFYHHVIRKVTPAGDVTTIAGQPGQQGNVGGAPNVSKLGGPHAITVWNGQVYFLDWNNAVRKIDSAGNVVTIPTSGGMPSSGFANSIVFKTNGELFINDRSSHGIWKRDTSGVWSIFAGSIGGVSGYLNGVGGSARFNEPRSMVIDPANNILVVDAGNCNIRLISPYQQVSTYAGTTCGHQDGTTVSAKFGEMNGIARAPNGDLYVSDSHNGNNYIRKITAAGIVTTVFGNVSGFLDGPFATAKTGMITSLALVGTNLYLADDNNYTVNNTSNRRLRVARLVRSREPLPNSKRLQ